MAIGDFNYSSNSNSESSGKKQLYENTYYSRIRVKNDNVKLALGFSYRSGLLIAEISEIKEGFKYDPIEAIYISPTKAMLLSKEIKKFKNYIADGTIIPNKAYGVTTGMGEKVSYIGFHLNEKGIVLITIGKIDGNGNITNSATIPLNSDYHYAIEWNNIETMDLEKVYYNYTELDQIESMLNDFARSMTGAFAYSVVDLGKFDVASIKSKMDPIYDKLGIERRSYGNNKNYGGENNFLNNAKSSNSNSTTFDDIEASFEDD
jgi:hypothetical protein